MTCHDYNLALFINSRDPNAYERKFKEVMSLRKIGAKSMFVRKTQNGKFKDPGWQADYCSEEDQRLYAEATARNKAEADQKMMEEKLRRNPWRPTDGIYANPGTNFEDRCLKAGDATVAFAERSIATGPDKCSITFIRDEPDAVQLFTNCVQDATAQGSTRNPKVILLKKIDDKTFSLQKGKDGNLPDTAENLSYCGRDAQRMHAERRTGK